MKAGFAAMIVAVLGGLAATGRAGSLAEAPSGVLLAPAEAPGLAQARRLARESLPSFLSRASLAPEGWSNLGLEIGVPATGGTEHVWVSDFSSTGAGRFEARLANDPVGFEGQVGDRIRFDQDQISDWAFVSGGRGYGFYSVRALLPGMAEAQRKSVQVFLSPRPLPWGW